MKLKKLSINKETLRNLQPSELSEVAGGARRGGGTTNAECSNPCPVTTLLCPIKTTVPDGCPSTVSSSGCGIFMG